MAPSIMIIAECNELKCSSAIIYLFWLMFAMFTGVIVLYIFNKRLQNTKSTTESPKY